MSTARQNLLVTGATGFIGRYLCATAQKQGYSVHAALRSAQEVLPDSIQTISVGRIDANTDWAKALMDIDVVVHLAGRAHVFEDHNEESDREFFAVNRDGTINLARQAAKAGVRRFVFISTIGVNGIRTQDDEQFATDSQARPHNAYAESKWLAENGLKENAIETNMEYVIIRPPLVYGPGNKGNFLRLMKLVNTRLPLPFASIENRRSLIYVGNLADAILTCCAHPLAANKTYLVSDGVDISTPHLMKSIATAFGQRCRLFDLPQLFTRLLAKMTNKSEAIDRLNESLMVDSSVIRNELGWVPPYSLELGISETASWFKSEYEGR